MPRGSHIFLTHTDDASEFYELKDKSAVFVPNEADRYFVFVDFYENYCNYQDIMEGFLERFVSDSDKELVLFVQSDCGTPDDKLLTGLVNIMQKITASSDIRCKVTIEQGDRECAKQAFLKCRHYIVSRTYDAVYFSCLADLLGMDIISGVDRKVQFTKKRNMVENLLRISPDKAGISP